MHAGLRRSAQGAGRKESGRSPDAYDPILLRPCMCAGLRRGARWRTRCVWRWAWRRACRRWRPQTRPSCTATSSPGASAAQVQTHVCSSCVPYMELPFWWLISPYRILLGIAQQCAAGCGGRAARGGHGPRAAAHARQCRLAHGRDWCAEVVSCSSPAPLDDACCAYASSPPKNTLGGSGTLYQCCEKQANPVCLQA